MVLAEKGADYEQVPVKVGVGSTGSRSTWSAILSEKCRFSISTAFGFEKPTSSVAISMRRCRAYSSPPLRRKTGHGNVFFVP